MYKNASKKQQRVSVLSIADLMGTDFEELPLEQQRENLVAKHKKITTSPYWWETKGEEQQLIQKAISAIRPMNKGLASVPHHFMSVCREEMTKFQFKLIMDKASIRAREDEAISA